MKVLGAYGLGFWEYELLGAGNDNTGVEKKGGGDKENHSGKVDDGVADYYEEVNDVNDDHHTYYTENVYGFSDEDRDWNIENEGRHEGEDEFGDSERA